MYVQFLSTAVAILNGFKPTQYHTMWGLPILFVYSPMRLRIDSIYHEPFCKSGYKPKEETYHLLLESRILLITRFFFEI